MRIFDEVPRDSKAVSRSAQSGKAYIADTTCRPFSDAALLVEDVCGASVRQLT